MPWLKAGDNAATYPKVMMTAALPGSDDRTANEVMGWLTRCMTQSAGHTTDYLVDMGTAALFGGPRTAELIRIGKAVGLIVRELERAGVPHLELIADPAFLHMRLEAELKAERQRKNDNTNPQVTAAVRLRDGDQCRWCGVVTWWGTADRKSGRVGTYDHLSPVVRSETKAAAADLVVACRSCNSSRADAEQWDRPLLPAPAPPHYSKASAEFIAKHLGIAVVVSEDQRTGSQPVIAPGDPAASGTTPQPPTGQAPDTRRPTGSAGSPVDPRGAGSGFTGSGRDGPVDGSGRDGPGRGRSGSPPRRRRRRGRRGHSS